MRTWGCWLLSKMKSFAGLGIILIVCLWGLDAEDDAYRQALTLMVVITPVSAILSIWAAIFTFKNFEEVYSRSKRWRNSNVEKLNTRICYSISMFFQCLFAFPVFILIIVCFYYIIKMI